MSIATQLPRAAGHTARRLTAPTEWSPWNPYVIRRVPPQAVSAVMRRRVPEHYRGRVLSGDWDLATVPLQETALFRGLQQRFVEGRDWADTDLHPDRYLVEFDNAPRKYLEYSIEEFLLRGEFLDRLGRALLRDGYRSHVFLYRRYESEMAVNIGRDGRLIRNSSGLHRLILGHLLGLPTVPVRILVTHRAWADGPTAGVRHDRSSA